MSRTTVLPKVVPTEQRTRVKPYIFLAALQVIDVVTTWFILNAWSERAEGNPLAAFILNSWGLEVGLAVMLAFKLSVVWLFYICQTGVKFAAAVYSLVIANNVIFILLWGWLAVRGRL